MCGIASYFGNDKDAGVKFCTNACTLLRHRGPDDKGLFSDENIALAHTRLSIIELSELGHQPMVSSCGRYTIIYNGEIYNHLDLRKKYLADHLFRGHSDTETIIELFRTQKEKMLEEMVGMWALIIWDSEARKIFISRDRFGQKPLYLRRCRNSWLLSSEIKPLLQENEPLAYDPTALAEYLALGNYGHLGVHTFFNDIRQFPEGSYAWLSVNDSNFDAKSYWKLPDIAAKDKVPFDKNIQKGLHDCIVEAVLSQTLSDVPIGITLSGGIDSSIIAGILATYYDKGINIFTAQSINSKYDETKYVDAVIKMNSNSNFIVHRNNLNELSIRDNLEKYIKIQEEPFGDPSIIAHGFLMNMAASAGVKVILNGQGADELFFGYNNMAQAVLAEQFKHMQFTDAFHNLNGMKLGKKYFARALLESFLPTLEYNLRSKSRIKRRNIIQPQITAKADNNLISLLKYDNAYNVWKESIYGVHIPHLVHYDDRNGMACSIEGRMPFLDHRIAEYVANIRTSDFLKNGLRKYILRESCKQYLPDSVYKRKDKIGFYTPLVRSLIKEESWVTAQIQNNNLFKTEHTTELIHKLKKHTLTVNDALHIWRCLSIILWGKEYNVSDLHSAL
jgi:asparagine synthase (glutamine-hydrolysing)